MQEREVTVVINDKPYTVSGVRSMVGSDDEIRFNVGELKKIAGIHLTQELGVVYQGELLHVMADNEEHLLLANGRTYHSYPKVGYSG